MRIPADADQHSWVIRSRFLLIPIMFLRESDHHSWAKPITDRRRKDGDRDGQESAGEKSGATAGHQTTVA